MNTRTETTAKERRSRQPLGVVRKKMTLDQKTMGMLEKENLVPRWVNDTEHGMRIQNAISGGYDFVSSNGDIIVGDTTKKEALNRRVRKLVGSNKDNSPLYSYLMAIKKEFYQEDQDKKEETNMMVDDAIRGGAAPGTKNHGVSPDKGGSYVKNVQYTP